jgi:hypothetical protein
MATTTGKGPAPRKRPVAAKKRPAAKAASKPKAAAPKKPAAAPKTATRKPKAAPRKAPPSTTAKLKAAAVSAEVALEDLAKGILAKVIRPSVKDVQRLAAAVMDSVEKRAKKKKATGGGKKKGGKKKLAKIPGQKKK